MAWSPEQLSHFSPSLRLQEQNGCLCSSTEEDDTHLCSWVHGVSQSESSRAAEPGSVCPLAVHSLVERASQPSGCVWELGQDTVLQSLPLPCPALDSPCEGKGRLCLTACSCSEQDNGAWTRVCSHAHTQCRGQGHFWRTVQAVALTPGCVLVAGEPLGLWPGMAVTVVVVLSVLVLLSAGILWAVLSR